MILIITILFLVDMLVLFISGVYGFYCALANPYQYINPMLQGRRAKVAVFVPFIWLYHVLSNAQIVYYYMESVQWDAPEWLLHDVAVRQGAGLTGTIISVLLIAGYKFGEK